MNTKIDIIGKIFGKWKVLRKLNASYYECQCVCEKIKNIKKYSLTSGTSKSCGCMKGNKNFIYSRKIDSGTKLNKLTIIDITGKRNKHGTVLYNCLCDCGNTKILDEISLLKNKIKSCGCLARERNKREYGQASFNNFYLRYKNSAKKRNLVFELNRDEFKILTSDNCYYCNTSPFLYNKKPEFKNGLYKYNGIDRKDNSIGYTIENCVTSCMFCNKAKRGMSLKEFLNWTEKVYQYNLSKGLYEKNNLC